MDNLETEFLNRHIPYRVDGHEPFFKRSEIKTLLDTSAWRDYASRSASVGGWLLTSPTAMRMLSAAC
jgi:hypothetical protein